MSKHYYVTTSIPYANAEPHIGFAMELIQADVLARFARQQGKDVIFSTGTDEHGTKIYEKALELGVDPEVLTDEMSGNFRALSKAVNASNNRFIRTTDESHGQRTQVVWKALKKDIYKDTYKGLYCVGCEAYVTEAAAKENNGECPDHKKAYVTLEEENYFFRLSHYADAIADAIKSETFQILPSFRAHEILNVISGGLDDISISRPVDKLPWGVPVPGDKKQVMYVWFEALLNYITVLGYPEHDDFKQYWPADVQVIGKDILRFHAAIWPGILHSLGIDLPKKLYVHGFISSDGHKMSKSLGNVVHPNQVIEAYGVDALRYYLLRHIPSSGDGDFTWEKFHDAYTTELGNELGNALQRTIVMVSKYFDGDIGAATEPGHDEGRFYQAMEQCQFDRALEEVWLLVRGLNQYIEQQKPWQLAKQDDKSHLKEVLRYQVGDLRQIAHLLEPFLPDTATKIQKALSAKKITPSDTTLFPRVEREDLPQEKE